MIKGTINCKRFNLTVSNVITIDVKKVLRIAFPSLWEVGRHCWFNRRNVLSSDDISFTLSIILIWCPFLWVYAPRPDSSYRPQILQKAYLQIRGLDDCRKNFGTKAPGGIVDHFICAYAPGKDACSVRNSSLDFSLIITCTQCTVDDLRPNSVIISSLYCTSYLHKHYVIEACH